MLASAWSPITSDAGEVLAPDLADAMTFLAALVERLRTQLESQRQEAVSTAEAWLTLDGDLHDAAQAAARLGQEVRHVAELEAEAGRQIRERSPAGRPDQPRCRRPGPPRHGRSRARWPARQAGCGVVAAGRPRREGSRRCGHWPRRAGARSPMLHRSPYRPSPRSRHRPTASATVRGRQWRHRSRAWLQQTERAGAALDEAARRFQAPLTRRDELRGLLQAFRDKAASAGLAEHEALDPLYTAARDTLWSAPCDLAVAESQVDDYVRTVNTDDARGRLTDERVHAARLHRADPRRLLRRLRDGRRPQPPAATAPSFGASAVGSAAAGAGAAMSARTASGRVTSSRLGTVPLGLAAGDRQPAHAAPRRAPSGLDQPRRRARRRCLRCRPSTRRQR